MTFNPNTVVDPVAKYGGRRCRGWPLLAKHFGVEVRATAVVDRCGVGDEKQPCGFDVVDCAKRRRLGGVRVLVTLTGSNVIDAATAERVDDDTLRVRWVPPEAGTYEVSAVLNWLYQVAAPQVDAYPSRGDPVYLGPTENRCPGGRCGRAQPFTLDECVKVAAVPLAPKTFTAVEAPSPKKPLEAAITDSGLEDDLADPTEYVARNAAGYIDMAAAVVLPLAYLVLVLVLLGGGSEGAWGRAGFDGTEIRHLHDGLAISTALASPDAIEDPELRSAFHAGFDPVVRTEVKALRDTRRSLAATLDRTPELMVMEELDTPRIARILDRGRYDRPGEAVEPGVPAVLGDLPALSDNEAKRLLAAALAALANVKAQGRRSRETGKASDRTLKVTAASGDLAPGAVVKALKALGSGKLGRVRVVDDGCGAYVEVPAKRAARALRASAKLSQ